MTALRSGASAWTNIPTLREQRRVGKPPTRQSGSDSRCTRVSRAAASSDGRWARLSQCFPLLCVLSARNSTAASGRRVQVLLRESAPKANERRARELFSGENEFAAIAMPNSSSAKIYRHSMPNGPTKNLAARSKCALVGTHRVACDSRDTNFTNIFTSLRGL